MEIYPSRNVNLPFLKDKKLNPQVTDLWLFWLQFRLPYLKGQKLDFFLSQINYVNNSSLSRGISNNFRNKLQVNDIPERPKTLILRAPRQIFIEAKRTRSYLAIWTHFGVTTSKTQNKKKSRTCVPSISPYLLHLKVIFHISNDLWSQWRSR